MASYFCNFTVYFFRYFALTFALWSGTIQTTRKLALAITIIALIGECFQNWKKGCDYMNIDKPKLTLAMARACMATRDLAAAADVSPQTINAALRGQNVRPAVLGRLARALGVDPTEIIAPETNVAKE